MTNKNKQMKIVGAAVILLLLISSIIATIRSSSSQAKPVDEDEKAENELVKAVVDLETIKDRIKNVEEGYRENYRSETNNGITIVGTLMEQMIDVMIAVLKQPLVAEAVSKRVVNKQDADEIAEYIEILGKEVVKEVEQTQLLRCARPVVEKCETVEGLKNDEGEPLQTCWYEEGEEGELPEDNCEAYKYNDGKVEEGTKRAAANLYNKVLSIVEKTEEQDKLYRITKNITIDNKKQVSLSTGGKVMKMDDFAEQKEFIDIAMAHYKYLGHDLKKELGESINIRELTEDEEKWVKYKSERRVGPGMVNVDEVDTDIAPPIDEDCRMWDPQTGECLDSQPEILDEEVVEGYRIM